MQTVYTGVFHWRGWGCQLGGRKKLRGPLTAVRLRQNRVRRPTAPGPAALPPAQNNRAPVRCARTAMAGFVPYISIHSPIQTQEFRTRCRPEPEPHTSCAYAGASRHVALSITMSNWRSSRGTNWSPICPAPARSSVLRRGSAHGEQSNFGAHRPDHPGRQSNASSYLIYVQRP